MEKYRRMPGTQDILPDESWKWQYIEEIMREMAHHYGYNEMRLPTFENIDLFRRGVGDTTDIVSKEMFDFIKGDREMVLRPEGTAGIVRAVLENGLLASSPLPLKNYYIQSCFRYEKMQKGRLREFHQFGIECFGAQQPEADVETIELAAKLLEKLNVADKVTLEINSIGCQKCRPAYHKDLKQYFEDKKDKLCKTCLVRLEKNPMRILDCKEENCKEIAKDAPVMLDYLCEECTDHFEKTKQLLDESKIPFVINPKIVRGLDYYTKTVFEFIASGVGTQGTVCAGGRYDGLIEVLGGQATPAVGFGLGQERLLMLMEQEEVFPAVPAGPLLYAVGMGDAGRKEARRLVRQLRDAGFMAEFDLSERSVKAQMKAAGRLNAVYTVVLGDSELESGKAALKRMEDGEQVETALADIVPVLCEVAKTM